MLTFTVLIVFPNLVLSQAPGWTLCFNTNNGYEFSKIFTLNENQAYVVGDSGLFLRTMNGGWTWEQYQTNTTSNFIDVQFINDSIGFISGENGTLIKTTDGGNTWNSCVTNTSLNLTGINFINNNFGWVAGSLSSFIPEPNDTGIILKTTDGGNTFTLSKSLNASVQKVAAYNVDTCIAICNYTSEFILRTTNSGSTWQEIQLASVGYQLSSIAIFSSGLTYVSPDGDPLYQSNDFGATWNSMNTFIAEQYPLDLSFPSPQIGYTAGFDAMDGWGSVCSTRNGGHTCKYEIETVANFVTVSFCNDSIGYAATGDGIIFKHGILTDVNSLKQPNKPNIIVYPNPAIDKITLELSGMTQDGNLTIVNMEGQQILTRQITELKTQLDISSLPIGVYFVRLSNDRTVEVGKIVKE